MDIFGQPLNYWWESLAYALTGAGAVMILCAAIFVIFAVFLIWFLKNSHPIKSQLYTARNIIFKYKEPTDFTANFHDIDEQLQSITIISQQWSEFVECLILPRQDESQVIKNTEDPSSYFSLEDIVGDRMNLRFYNAVPNILTGLGILFTFIGLAFGIYLAQDSIISTDQKLMLEALSNLLGGASLAFWTSVAGLLFSIIFNISEKKQVHGIQKMIGQFNQQLDRLLDRTTEEKIANEILNENKEQRIQLQKFNTDLAISIASALDEKLAGSLKPTLESLVEAMDKLRDEKVRQNESFLQNLATDFRNSLSDAAKTEMTELSGSLNELSTHIKETISELSNAGEGAGQNLIKASESFAADMKKMLEENMTAMNEHRSRADLALETATSKMSEHIDLIADLVEETTNNLGTQLKGSATEAGRILSDSAGELSSELHMAAERMQSVQESTESQMQKFQETLNSLNVFNESSRESLSTLRETIDSLRVLHESIKTTAEPLVDVSVKFGDVSKNLDSSLEAINDLSEQLEENSDKTGELADKLQESWTNIERRYVGLDESLGKVFDQFNTAIDQYAEKYRTFLNEIDNSFEKSLNILSGTIQELKDILEDYEISQSPSNITRGGTTEQ